MSVRRCAYVARFFLFFFLSLRNYDRMDGFKEKSSLRFVGARCVHVLLLLRTYAIIFFGFGFTLRIQHTLRACVRVNVRMCD